MSGKRCPGEESAYVRNALCVIAVLISAFAAVSSFADEAPSTNGNDVNSWIPLRLESYEPSALGYTKNNDDEGFENIKLSVKVPLFPDLVHGAFNGVHQFYLSFTGYWGFYATTRNSGPVVGKEYNPQLFWQYNLPCGSDNPKRFEPQATVGSPPETPETRLNCYFVLGYNHDSNGQIIDSLSLYNDTVRRQTVDAGEDDISRGWDFIRLSARYYPFWHPDDRLAIYPTVKYFLVHGLLQTTQEELHDWEHPYDGKPRREVDGLSVLVKYEHNVSNFAAKVALSYTTGYTDPARFSTVRLELGAAPYKFPIVLWYQKGYMSDLAQYYRNVTGYGIELEIGGF